MRRDTFAASACLLWLLGAAGCSSPADPAGTEQAILPLAQVLAAPPEWTAIGPDWAALRVETTVPLVCALVFGETPQMGRIATDSDMAGGAHREHAPRLEGLQPDTEYFWRLQGIAADGSLYRGETYTFRTAPADNTAEINWALPIHGARVVGVSSNYGGAANAGPWGAELAIDGLGATAWSSNGDGNGAWIEIDLGQTIHVQRIGFWTRTMGNSAEIFRFRIITDRGEVVGPFRLSDATQADYFITDFTARRLRFEAIETSGGNTGVVTIEVYGDPT